jgi:hypothetical protein
MKYFVILFITLLSPFSLDLNRFKFHRQQPKKQTAYIDLTAIKSERKRTQRRFCNSKHKRKIKYIYKAPKYKSTKPKAHRFNNQKSLRRMYRNC